MRFSNAMLDVNRDGVINRTDAFLAKELCTLRLCNIPVLAPATVLNVAAVYDEKNSLLDLNDVQVGKLHYRAQLQLKDNNLFELNSAQLDISRYAIPARYDIEAAILEVPSVYINEKNYRALLRNIGDSKFRLEYFEEIDTILK